METITTIKVLCNGCELEFSKEFDGTLPECPECKSKLISIIGYIEKRVDKKKTEFVQLKERMDQDINKWEDRAQEEKVDEDKNKIETKTRFDVLLGKLRGKGGKTLKFK